MIHWGWLFIIVPIVGLIMFFLGVCLALERDVRTSDQWFQEAESGTIHKSDETVREV